MHSKDNVVISKCVVEPTQKLMRVQSFTAHCKTWTKRGGTHLVERSRFVHATRFTAYVIRLTEYIIQM
jgi:hypothetical protein